mgnify:CR=1 FL=1
MYRDSRGNSFEEERRGNKKWGKKSNIIDNGVAGIFLKKLRGKLKSLRLIVIIFLAIAAITFIPIIPVLLAFFAGRWVRYSAEKS